MQMAVFSYPELYTTAFGWMLYNALWEMLTLTGIAWLPLAIALYQHTREPMESQESRDASAVSLRRMMWSVGVMFIVIAFGAVPFVNVSMSTMTFTCQPTQINTGQACRTGVSYGNTGTAYDGASMPGYNQTGEYRMPVLWAGITSISSGLIAATISSMPEQAGLRDLQAMMQAAQITDPRIAAETKRFVRECYIPAMNKLDRILGGEVVDNADPLRAQIMEKWALNQDSMDYIGNKVLLDTPGLYGVCGSAAQCGSTLTATQPVPGFIDQDPDTLEMVNGKPTCQQWWVGDGIAPGLRTLLLNEGAKNAEAAAEASAGTTQSAVDKIKFAIQASTNTIGTAGLMAQQVAGAWQGSNADDHAEELLIQRASMSPAVRRSGNDIAYTAGLAGAKRLGGEVLDSYYDDATSTMRSAGLLSESFSLSVKMPLMMKAAPLVQSVLIMVFLALLPFLLILGRFTPGAFLACALGYFTLRFWTALWALAGWMDQTMLSMYAANQAMFIEESGFQAAGTFNGAGGMAYARYVTNMTSFQMETVIELVTATLWVGMPVLFSMMLGWVGVQGMKGLNDAFGAASATTGKAAERGEQMGRTAAGAVAGAATAGAGAAAGVAAGGRVAGSVVQGTIRS